jgi:hypothetical protein
MRLFALALLTALVTCPALASAANHPEAVQNKSAIQTNSSLPPQLRPWREYRTIMWVGDSAYKRPEKTALFFQRLREMSINTAMVYGDADPRPLLDNTFPYYVENLINRGLCLKWNSQVRDWDKFVTGWAKGGRPESALVRDYCLDDPQWREWARGEMQRSARKHRQHEPLAYDIRDELSTTISANPFDYDFNPIALAGFRDWLKTQYADLAALNAEWETRFASWDEVKPFTTDQIKNRMASGQAPPEPRSGELAFAADFNPQAPVQGFKAGNPASGNSLPQGQPDWQQVQRIRFDPATARQSPTRWNFSPWADFRTYMDISLARVLAGLRDAAHEVDPRTPVGIEGTQMPHAFGGYDLWRLGQSVDWVEPYDICNAREILGSFMPGKPMLTTVFESDTAHARRRLWHLLLEGDRGCIIWWSEDCIDWASADFHLTPKAKALAPVLSEMTSPLARLFLRATPERDPIFLHYSQPSIQVDWLMESTVDGSTWLRRFSSFEADHNHFAQTRDGWLKVLQDLGFSPQFISTAQIESGELRQPGHSVLVLPSSWALSEKEASEIAAFAKSRYNANAKMAAILHTGAPGLFDAHGKLRPASMLESLPAAPEAPGDLAQYAVERLKREPAGTWTGWLSGVLGPLRPEISLPAGARVRVHRFRVANGRLLAFERNIEYQMSEELKQAGGNEALERPESFEATLAQPAHVYDLRTLKYLGHTNRIRFTLDPWQPSLFALTQTPLPDGKVIESLEQ